MLTEQMLWVCPPGGNNDWGPCCRWPGYNRGHLLQSRLPGQCCLHCMNHRHRPCRCNLAEGHSSWGRTMVKSVDFQGRHSSRGQWNGIPAYYHRGGRCHSGPGRHRGRQLVRPTPVVRRMSRPVGRRGRSLFLLRVGLVVEYRHVLQLLVDVKDGQWRLRLWRQHDGRDGRRSWRRGRDDGKLLSIDQRLNKGGGSCCRGWSWGHGDRRWRCMRWGRVWGLALWMVTSATFLSPPFTPDSGVFELLVAAALAGPLLFVVVGLAVREASWHGWQGSWQPRGLGRSGWQVQRLVSASWWGPSSYRGVFDFCHRERVSADVEWSFQDQRLGGIDWKINSYRSLTQFQKEFSGHVMRVPSPITNLIKKEMHERSDLLKVLWGLQPPVVTVCWLVAEAIGWQQGWARLEGVGHWQSAPLRQMAGLLQPLQWVLPLAPLVLPQVAVVPAGRPTRCEICEEKKLKMSHWEKTLGL